MSVLKKANVLTLTKLVTDKYKNIRTLIAATTDNSVEELSGQKIWPSDAYFKSQVTDHNMEKVNCHENLLFYEKQSILDSSEV